MRLVASVLFCLLPLSAQSLSNRRAPGFSLPDSTATQHDLQDYRGKWVLLDFMKTDCPHCMALSHTLEEVKAQLGSKVAILSIVVAPPENTNTVAHYVASQKVTTPIVFDQGQVAASYFKLTPTNPSYDTPHLFVVNPVGTIVKDWSDNPLTTDLLEKGGLAKELQALMSAAPAQK